MFALTCASVMDSLLRRTPQNSSLPVPDRVAYMSRRDDLMQGSTNKLACPIEWRRTKTRQEKAFSFNETKFVDDSQRACGPDEKSQNIPEDIDWQQRNQLREHQERKGISRPCYPASSYIHGNKTQPNWGQPRDDRKHHPGLPPKRTQGRQPTIMPSRLPRLKTSTPLTPTPLTEASLTPRNEGKSSHWMENGNEAHSWRRIELAAVAIIEFSFPEPERIGCWRRKWADLGGVIIYWEIVTDNIATSWMRQQKWLQRD